MVSHHRADARVSTLIGRERAPWLDELDAELAKKAEYDARKEARIGQLRGVLRSALNDNGRYEAARALFEEYKSYKYDSAFVYAQRLEELASRLDQPDLTTRCRCG